MERKIKANAEEFIETVWLNRPLKSLANLSPIDAVASTKIRKRVFGAVRFLESCYDAARPRIQNGDEILSFSFYDFDRARRKLGLTVTGSGDQAQIAKLDIGAMGTAELGQLETGTLDEPQLNEAYRTALKLDARELAGMFAGKAIEKFPGRRTMGPYFHYLIGAAESPDAGARTIRPGRGGRRRTPGRKQS